MTIFVTVILVIFCFSLIWAYIPDYKRNPKEFKRTIIGMPLGMFLATIGLGDLNEKIKKWAIGKKKEKKIEK